MLPDGTYKIFNVAFPTQDAELWRGQPTAKVVGNVNNTDSLNMVWDLKVINPPHQVTLSCVGRSANGAYAHINKTGLGEVVHGSTTPTGWFMYPVSNSYVIEGPSANGKEATLLMWSLSDKDDGTPITLQRFAEGNNLQLWHFEPYDVNTTSSLADLD